MPFTAQIPPWIPNAPGEQISRMYLAGLERSASLASDAMRLSAQQAANEQELAIKSAQLEMQAQAQQKTLEASMAKAKQQLLMEKAYKDSMLSLRSRGLDITAAKQRQAASEAAAKFAAQSRMGEALRSGKTFEEAMFANPELMTPGVTEALIRGREQQKDYGEPIIKDIPDIPGGKIVYRKNSPGAHVVIPPRTGLTRAQQVGIEDKISRMKRSLADYPPGDPERTSIEESIGRYNDLLKQDAAPAKPTPTVATAEKKIRVRSPKGKTGTIPESQKDEALAAGYTLLE